MEALEAGKTTDTLRFIPRSDISLRAAVPIYYDRRFDEAFAEAMRTERFSGLQAATLGDLLEDEVIEIRNGHGSPSADQRVGEVPYIKVSDLRAGLVNINPTNRVPYQVAQKFWRNKTPDLQAFDLLCPERTSKNIGDFCVLMPGQETILLTREVIVIRPGRNANFDSFYLLWALTLKIVRDQWKRVVFMQTNREDVGRRYLEIAIPVPDTREIGEQNSEAFREYFQRIADARSRLSSYLDSVQDHHFFVSGTEPPEEDDDGAAKPPSDE
jgi:type I restriction enzyme M protein